VEDDDNKTNKIDKQFSQLGYYSTEYYNKRKAAGVYENRNPREYNKQIMKDKTYLIIGRILKWLFVIGIVSTILVMVLKSI
tara:strand:- start:38 stop:280 length:243 start_codon:yes stop_codon:yes gene_type:complete